LIIDTHVLLRLVDGPDGPDGPQYAQVSAALEQALKQGERIIVTAATMHEVVFVLASARTGYGYTRTEVAAEVAWLLDTPELDVEHASALRHAAASYAEHKAIDFHDCYLSALGRVVDQRVFSLDEDFDKL